MNTQNAEGSHHILWIHGFGTSPEVWEDCAKAFPDCHHHYVSFQTCSTAEQLKSKVRDSIAMHAKEAEEKRALLHVVGWSLGGMLALDVLFDDVGMDVRLWQSVGSLTLVSASLQFTSRDRAKGWPSRIVERMQARLHTEPEETLKDFHSLLYTDLERSLRNEPSRAIRNEFSVSGLEAGLSYLLNQDLTDTWEHLRHAKLPMLWMHGTADAVCPIGAVPESIASSQFVPYQDAGHVLFHTQQELFLTTLRSFVNDAIASEY